MSSVRGDKQVLADVLTQVPQTACRLGVLGVAQHHLTAVGAHTQVACKHMAGVTGGVKGQQL